jgi:predicted ATPase
MRRDLPSGTVTFLFTDIEGSTKLLHEVGEEDYARALAEHRRLVREASAARGGVEVDTQGDAFFVVFPNAPGAVQAAKEAQEALARGRVRVRMGLHTGTPRATEEGYVGRDVHKGARIAAAGHGGQVLLSTDTRQLVDEAVTDLGEHRLKDFDDPVPIFQLGQSRFPPLKTISNTNLPRPASSFVGRVREVADVVSHLRDHTRLLTLSGPGGSGKTRLAIEAATELVSEFKAGVFWVGLAPLRDPSLVVEEIARTLGAKDGLAEHIGEREMLVLLDNLEQVIESAPELATLLEACLELRLLVTSRELLRVRGEVEYPVPPLAEPEAVTLFCERSRLRPDATIAELCSRLDSLPLAVELAAARTRVLSPVQILDRIARRLDLLEGGRDADPRHRTLRATIAWSYDLLSPEEQWLFEQLSVFAGGCTLEAAEDVADADLGTLQSLVEKSLLRFTNERYWMLEMTREFAAERLAESGEAEGIQRRHADWFLAVAEEAEPHLRQESLEWLDQLDLEHDNVRAALDRLEEAGEHELALRLAAAVWWIWSLRGHIAEGRRRLDSALAGDLRPTAARAMALTGACDLAADDDDNLTARHLAEEALALHRELGDEWGMAYCLLGIGVTYAFEDDFPNAQPRFDESVRLFSGLGDEHWSLQATIRLAWSYDALGDLEHARALHEDILRRARASGDPAMEARSLSVLATYVLEEGRVDETVVSMLVEAHHMHRDRPTHPDLYWDAVLLCRFARALALKDEAAAAAARLLSCFDALLEEIKGPAESWVTRWVTRMNDETLAIIGERLDDRAIAEAREQGEMLTADDAVALALDALV